MKNVKNGFDEAYIELLDKLGFKVSSYKDYFVSGILHITSQSPETGLAKSLELTVNFLEVNLFSATLNIDVLKVPIIIGQTFADINQLESIIDNNRILKHLMEFKIL